MCSLSKEQSILSRETIFFFFFKSCPFFDLDFLSSIKHSTDKHWHPHAVLFSLSDPSSTCPSASINVDVSIGIGFWWKFCVQHHHISLSNQANTFWIIMPTPRQNFNYSGLYFNGIFTLFQHKHFGYSVNVQHPYLGNYYWNYGFVTLHMYVEPKHKVLGKVQLFWHAL